MMKKRTFFYIFSLAFIIFSFYITSYIIAQMSRENITRENITAYMWVNINNEWKKLYKNGENVLAYNADEHDGNNWYGNTISALRYEDNNYITQEVLEEFFGQYGFNSSSNWNIACSSDSNRRGNYLGLNCEKSNIEGENVYRLSGQTIENIYVLPNSNVDSEKERENYALSDAIYTITLEDGTIKYVVVGDDITIELGQLEEGYCWVASGRNGDLITSTDSNISILDVDQPYTISKTKFLEDEERFVSTSFKLHLGIQNENIKRLIANISGLEFNGYEDKLSSESVFYVPVSAIQEYFSNYGYSYEENSACQFSSVLNIGTTEIENGCQYVNIKGENCIKITGIGENRNSHVPISTVYYNGINTVVFDGTNGWQSSYQGAGRQAILIETDDLVGDKARVMIPNAADIAVPSDKFKLIGWYDIINEKYYDSSFFGKEILTTSNAIFYADWIAASYDNGVAEATKESVDTSSFIRTYLYDYNDLINVLESKYNVDDKTWSLRDSQNSFVFFSDIVSMGKLGHVNGTSGSGMDCISKWTGSSRPHQGILQKRPDIIDKVFDRTGQTVGVHYLGTANGLFYKNSEGLYEYDSDVAAMSYNQSEGKIKLYDHVQNISLKNGKHVQGQFLMLNGENEEYREDEVNYWFGLENEIYFDLQSNVGSGANIIDGKDMIFSFSGDDDVWVFLDDKLVLDIGGIHDESSASINFNTGECYVNGVKQDNIVAEAGEHVLKMYYLERGGNSSNLKTSFLLSPVTSVRIKKVDKDNKTKRIKNAEFTLTNESGKYYTQENEIVSWSDTKKTIVTNDRGVFKFIGLVDGVYTLHEENAPFGYNRNPLSATIVVSNGVITSISSEGIEDISGLYTIEGKATLVAYNEKIKVPVTVTKVWNDNNNEAGKRPKSITLQVKNGDEVVQEAEVSEETNWSYEFNVPKYDDLGNVITYTVDEKDTGNIFYEKEKIEGNTITNIFKVPDEKVSVDAVKVWNDNNNEAGKRQTSITLQVKNGNAVVQEAQVSEENNWSHTFTDLPKYDELGNEITYTVDEKDSGNKFYEKEKIEGNTITNIFKVPDEKVSVDAIKVWNDNNNEAGKRPTSITLQVKNGNAVVQEAQVSEENNWSHTFTNLPKYDELGNEITYTVDEKDSGNKFYEKEKIEGNTITNIFKVPDEKVSVDAVKVWNDNNNELGKRPTSITLQVKVGYRVIQEAEVIQEDNWRYTFTNLPKYDEQGNEITYTIDEKDSGNKFYVKEKVEGNTITNKFEVPRDTVRITGIKAWNDNNNEAGKRPTSITLQVKNGDEVVQESQVSEESNWSHTFTDLPKYDEQGNEITYTIDEKDSGNKFYEKEKIEGYTVTNIFKVPDEKVNVDAIKVWNDNNNEAGKRPTSITLQVKVGDKVIQEAEVIQEDNWRYTFTNLPKYDEQGNEITYTIDEKNSGNEFYVKEKMDGNTITNKFEVSDENTKITGIKAWNDNNNEAGKRPSSIILQVKNGDNVVQEAQVGETSNWSHTFTNLPKYDEQGNEIVYTVDEKDSGNEFYIKEKVERNTITNKFIVPDEKVSVDVVKVWNDNNNEAGKRPTSITLQVKNGDNVVQEAQVGETSNWSHTFTNLPKYDEQGNEIVYTVDEKGTGNKFYVKEKIEGNIITNKFIVSDEKVSVDAVKVWNDNNNEVGKRPTSITLQVKNGDNVVQEAQVGETSNWSHTFTNLPKYDEQGNEIVYTVDEKDSGNEFYIKEKVERNTITNKFIVPDEKVSVDAVKVWNDNNNGVGKRPTSITLQVKNGDNVVQEAQVGETSNWSHTFTDLPKYDEQGNEIVYTVDEKDSGNEFYIKEKVERNTITNKFIVPDEKVSVDAVKVWNDNNNEAGKRPTSIILQVKNGDNVVQEAQVDETSNWSHTFTDLPKYDEQGNEIVYIIDEKDSGNEFYIKEKVEGNTVTNKFIVSDEKVSVDAIKIWEDNNNEEGKRPSSITLQVKNENEVVQEAEVTQDDNWRHTFTNLPKYDEQGNEITYTIDEKDSGNKFYRKKKIEGNTITNRLVIVKDEVSITIKKVWNDDNNKAGKRPNSATLQIKVGDEVVEEVEVSEETNWSYDIDLPMYDEQGNEIKYTVDEKDNGNIFYKKEITDDTTVTNTFVVPEEKIDITGIKVWEDNNNKAGKRPEHVILQIKAGDSIIQEAKVSEENNWRYTFTQLPKYDELGNEIIYTIDEKDNGNIFYKKKITGNTTVTNTFIVPEEKIDIAGTKVWKDNNNKTGKRPESVILQLKAGDNVIQEVKISEENNWTYVFTQLSKYDELGNEIIYTIDEKDTSKDYEKKIEGYTIVNTLIEEPQLGVPAETSDIDIFGYIMSFMGLVGVITIFKLNKIRKNKIDSK